MNRKGQGFFLQLLTVWRALRAAETSERRGDNDSFSFHSPKCYTAVSSHPEAGSVETHRMTGRAISPRRLLIAFPPPIERSRKRLAPLRKPRGLPAAGGRLGGKRPAARCVGWSGPAQRGVTAAQGTSTCHRHVARGAGVKSQRTELPP